MKNWKLVDFNEELGEIAAHAHCCGPQRVAVNGDVDVIVLSPAEYARLSGEPLPPLAVDSGTEPKSALGLFAEIRRIIDEAAGEEDLSWPWDWDCETREWVLPVDHAVSA
jgi:hypothetical protein